MNVSGEAEGHIACGGRAAGHAKLCHAIQENLLLFSCVATLLKSAFDALSSRIAASQPAVCLLQPKSITEWAARSNAPKLRRCNLAVTILFR